MAFDWKRLEDTYTAQAQRVVERIVRANPRHTFYAIALQESYRELDGTIGLPYLALQSVEALRKEQGDDARYDLGSPNWKWTVLAVNSPELKRLQGELDAEANRSTQAHWRRTEQRFVATMVSVCKRLYADFKQHPQATPDCIVFFDDEDGGLELAKRCVSKALFDQHFAAYEEDEDPAPPPKSASLAQKLKAYLRNTERYEKELAALDERALPDLIGLLDTEDGWEAARIIGQIGVATQPVIQALRRQVREARDGANWCASALESLGDTEGLFELAERDKSCGLAIGGLLHSYRSWANEWPNRKKLNYRTLERILDRKLPAWTRAVKDELSPGSGFVEIKADEIDEALQGLNSPHVLIRQHAVCILGERNLGAAAGKRILPALAERLNDPHANVRRLALFSISEWKSAAKPYFPQIRRLLKDKNAEVHAMARAVIAGRV